MNPWLAFLLGFLSLPALACGAAGIIVFRWARADPKPFLDNPDDDALYSAVADDRADALVSEAEAWLRAQS